MIYTTHRRTVSTQDTHYIDGINVPQNAHFFPETYKRAKMGISYPPHKLMEKCFDQAFLEEIEATRPAGKCAFLLSTGSQIWTHESSRFPMRNDLLDYKLKLPYISMTQIYAGRLSSQFKAFDHVSTDGSACASSMKSMMDVFMLIEYYGFDRVILAAVDDVVNNAQLNIFGEAGASISAAEEDAGLKPSAFDSVNRGFRLGQGAAIAVFEREHPKMSAPVAQLLGTFSASEDLDNSIGQRLDGAGFRDAISMAMKHAKVSPQDIKMIKTHGTGTDLNNISERAGLEAAGLKDFIATSFKAKIGHTMGPSGLLESILALDAIKDGYFPKIENRTEKDDVFLSDDAPAQDGLLLSIASGMGNIYSASIFKPLKA